MKFIRILKRFLLAFFFITISYSVQFDNNPGGSFTGFLYANSQDSDIQNHPVILIHGIWGDRDSWKDYANHLKNTGWVEGPVISFAKDSFEPKYTARSSTGGRMFFRIEFKGNDNQTFITQGKQVSAAVELVKKTTGSSKVILIGRSMGGLAARAYLQSGEYRNDVSVLITVSTPHLGSFLAYWKEDTEFKKMKEKHYGSYILSEFLIGKNFDAPAVSMLAPDSPEMIELNTMKGSLKRLPDDVHYICILSQYNLESDPNWKNFIPNTLATFSKAVSQYLSSHYDAEKSYSFVRKEHLGKWDDGVVPLLSQDIRVVPAGYGKKIDWEIVESLHTKAPGNQNVWKIIEGFIGGTSLAGSSLKTDLDLALVIDSSGSMAQNDKDNIRIKASKLFVDMLRPNDKVTIVDFDGYAYIYADGETDKDILKRAIDRIDSNGSTDIKKGLEKAYEALIKRKDSTIKGVVLLSDGGTDAYSSEADLFKNEGWPVFSVGLTNTTNESLLRMISQESGGKYFKARTAYDLLKLFNIVSAQFMNQTPLLIEKDLILSGERKTYTLNIDNSIKTVLFSLLWPGSNLDMTIIDPKGMQYSPSIAESSYEFLQVNSPASGTWKISVQAIQVSPGGENFDLTAIADTNLRPQVSGIYKSYRPGENLSLNIKIKNLNTLNGSMKITKPDGSSFKIDGKAGSEGLKLAFKDTQEPGDYEILYTVSGTDSSGTIITRSNLHTLSFEGEAYKPGTGEVIKVVGSYVTINIGKDDGVRTGMGVKIYDQSSATVLATGYITEVGKETSIIELLTLGSRVPAPGDTAKINPEDWKRAN